MDIPKDFRIIGTLNTQDKHFLFELSDALKSRFAYIEIDIPEFEEKENKMEALNNNLGNEANYNKWLSEEVDLLEETKNKIQPIIFINLMFIEN